MKRLLLILTLFLFFINSTAFGITNAVKKDYTVITPDGFRLSATLEYPKEKGVKEYKTIVLLHSLGYNSEWWDTLPANLLEKGYAVLMIDMRGHGKSVYNPKLVRVSWKSLTNAAYKKYPDDMSDVINYIKGENPKKIFFNEWAIVGSDIGAATGIIGANNMNIKPKTIVMLSPVIKAKGLFVPVKLAELSNTDILSICGVNDSASQDSQEYLKKFAQAGFVEYSSESKASGMLMFKSDNTLAQFITAWISQYLK